MGLLGQEAKNIQNSALGAVLLWRFAVGFEENSPTRNHPPIPLLYLVLPLLLHGEIEKIIKSTNQASGLRTLVGKFSKAAISKNDLLLNIQKSALGMRKLSTDALRQAIAAKILSIIPEKGTAIPLSKTSPRGIPKSIQELLNQAEKFGKWCAELTIYEIAIIMKVGF